MGPDRPAGGSVRARRWRLLAVLLAVVGLVAGTVVAVAGTPGRRDASTSLFPAVADAYVNRAHPTTNYGSASRLRVDTGPMQLRTYLRFSVPAVHGRVTRVVLQVNTGTSNPMGLQVTRAGGSWREDALTWSNAPAVGPVLASTGPTRQDHWSAADITSMLDAGSGAQQVDLALTAASATQQTISSRETGSPARLEVTTNGPVRRPAPGAPTATAAPADETHVVTAAGDIACAPAARLPASNCRQRATAGLLLATSPEVVLPLGDNQYETGSLADFTGSYGPSWGRLRTISRPAVGNHEYLTPGAAGYFHYFGAAAGDPTKGYYSFDVGSWHLIALNSNCSRVGGCGAGSPQETWLRQDLAANSSTCTLAYWHHPRFSSGQHGSNTAYTTIWQDLYDAGADLVLTAHDHDYERFAPLRADGTRDDERGLRSFVVGTGGRNHYRLGARLPGSETADDDTFGVLELGLHAASYDWHFVPATKGGFTDAGSGSCH